jgi:hypothetical protein
MFATFTSARFVKLYDRTSRVLIALRSMGRWLAAKTIVATAPAISVNPMHSTLRMAGAGAIGRLPHFRIAGDGHCSPPCSDEAMGDSPRRRGCPRGHIELGVDVLQVTCHGLLAE